MLAAAQPSGLVPMRLGPHFEENARAMLSTVKERLSGMGVPWPAEWPDPTAGGHGGRPVSPAAPVGDSGEWRRAMASISRLLGEVGTQRQSPAGLKYLQLMLPTFLLWSAAHAPAATCRPARVLTYPVPAQRRRLRASGPVHRFYHGHHHTPRHRRPRSRGARHSALIAEIGKVEAERSMLRPLAARAAATADPATAAERVRDARDLVEGPPPPPLALPPPARLAPRRHIRRQQDVDPLASIRRVLARQAAPARSRSDGDGEGRRDRVRRRAAGADGQACRGQGLQQGLGR